MKRHILRTFALLMGMFFLHSSATYASHIVGGDITYTCTSTPGVWHITLTFYRDCQGIPVCPQVSCGASCTRTVSLIGVEGNCTGVSYASSISLNLTSVSDVNINPLCPNAKSICDNMGCITPGTYTPGIEKYIFEGDVDLNAYSIPSNCCKINIVFQEAARAGAINTGSAGQNFYLTAMLDRCAAANNPCNNSPLFTNDPFALICVGERFMFNHGATDPDGDSLSYSFVPALQSAGTSVTYNSPYSYDKPMPWLDPLSDPFPYGIHCDSINGDIGFTPTVNLTPGQPFVGVVAIEATQWRSINGTLAIVGKTRRDIQMMVQDCPPNNSPTFLTNPPDHNKASLPNLSWSVCPGTTLCFDIIAKDTDFKPTASPPVSDTTYMSWNGSLSSLGATFTPKYTIADRRKPAPLGGPREDIYQFCWTPDSTMARNLPYYFTISAKDSRCPKPGKVTRAFSVKVLSRAKASIAQENINCGVYKLSLVKQDPQQNFSGITWNISHIPDDYSRTNVWTYLNTLNPPAQTFSAPGKYLVEVIVSTPGPLGLTPCTNSFTDTINVITPADSTFHPDAGPSVSACDSITTTLHASGGQLYQWKNLTTDSIISPKSTNPDITITAYSTTDFEVTAFETVNGIECAKAAQTTVTINHTPAAPHISGNDTTHLGSSTYYSVPFIGGYTYTWFIENGTINSGQGSRAIYASFNALGSGTLKVVESMATCKGDTGSKTVIVDNAVGLTEQNDFEHFNLYPNPTTGIINIELKTDEKQITVEIIDVSGKLAKTAQYTSINNDFHTSLDLTSLKAGMYFITIKSGNKSARHKITLK